jgi:hypothetical protein
MKKLYLVTAMIAIAARPAPAQPQTKDTPISSCPDGGHYRFSDQRPYGILEQENDPEKQLTLLDTYVSQHPAPELLVYIYPLYMQTQEKLQNFRMVIEYADKLLALGDKVGVEERYLASYKWSTAYNNLDSKEAALAAKALARASEGAEVARNMEKPQCGDTKAFEAQKKSVIVYFQATAGAAAIRIKDYPAALDAIKAILAQEEVELTSPSGSD